MIYLDIQHLCEARGIEKPLHYLHKNGFTYHTAHRLLTNYNEGILYKHLEKLCILFNCTPEDLLSWKPIDNSIAMQTHALQKLNRIHKGNINKKLQTLPAHKLDKIRQFIDDLDNEENG